MNKVGREALFQFINEVSFAIDDIVLFLDTHPNNREALRYYEEYKKLRQQAVNEYTRLYGPLQKDEVISSNGWTWGQGPWPWERSAN